MSETIEPTTETGTALAVIKTALPTILAADTNDILGKLAAELKSFARDGSTEKGRAEIGSKKRKAGSARQDMIRLADALKEDAQKTIKGVNAEVKVINDRFDTLISWIEAPRVAYEEQEKNRIADHEQAIQRLAVDPAMEHATSEEMSAAIQWRLEPEARNWQEFHQRAIDAHADAIATLRRWRYAAERREAEAAELANLRAAEAERARLAAIEAQRQREEQIARDATLAAEAEAERKAQKAAADALRAHQEAEARAQAERDAAAQRERGAAEALAAAERRAEQAAEIARQVAARAEAVRIAAHQAELETMRKLAVPLEHPDPVGVIDAKISRLADVYNREWEEFDTEATELFAASSEALKEFREESERLAEEATARKRQTDADAEAARQAAAVDAERKRAAEAKRVEDAETAKRAANRAHQAKINGDILTDLVTAMASVHEGNADEAKVIAVVIIKAIARGEVRHIAISY